MRNITLAMRRILAGRGLTIWSYSSDASTPNGEVQRGRERRSDVDERLASRPPLQRLVRPLPVTRRLSCLLYRRLPGALFLSFARLLLLLLLARFAPSAWLTWWRFYSLYLYLSLYGFSSCRSAFAAAALSASSHSSYAEPWHTVFSAFRRRRHGSLPVAPPHRYLIAPRSSMHFDQSGLTPGITGRANGTGETL